MAATMSLIEFEWAEAQERTDKRPHMIVQSTGMKTLC
jgi:hypothetical protein